MSCLTEDNENFLKVSKKWGTSLSRVDVAELIGRSELSLLLECPVCLEVPIPPVFLCTTGHIICGTCLKKVKACTICSKGFPGTRNFFYENLFEKTSFLCKFSIDGCKIVTRGKDLKLHQDQCGFRPLPCIKYGCPNMQKENHIAFSKFMEHFTSVHCGKVNKTNGGKVCNGFPEEAYTWIVSRWAHEVYHFGGYHFFAISQIRKPEVGIWVWVLGDDEVAKKFRVTIKLGDCLQTTNNTIKQTEQKNNVSLIWEGPVHSIRKTADEVLDSGKCLITSMNNVKSLCISQNSKVYWEVYINITEANDYQPSHNVSRALLLEHVSRRNSIRNLVPHSDDPDASTKLIDKYA